MIENTLQYKEGKVAFENGKSKEDNPYLIKGQDLSLNAMKWNSGYEESVTKLTNSSTK